MREPNPSDVIASPRFHGSIQLDALRMARDVGAIADHFVAHLAALPGAEVDVVR